MTEDTLPSLEDLGLETDYMVVDGSVYAMKKIGKGVKVVNEVRAFCRRR
jgi:hypothetical protein